MSVHQSSPVNVDGHKTAAVYIEQYTSPSFLQLLSNITSTLSMFWN